MKRFRHRGVPTVIPSGGLELHHIVQHLGQPQSPVNFLSHPCGNFFDASACPKAHGPPVRLRLN
jgi:hypothetical protein